MTIKFSQEQHNFALPLLALKTTQEIEHALNKSIRAQHDCHNLVVRRVHKLIRELNNIKPYWVALKNYHRAKKRLDNKKITKTQEKYYNQLAKTNAKIMNDIRKEIGLTEFALQSWINHQRKQKYNNILNSDALQKEVTNIWKSVQKYLFKNGKKIHYQRWDDIHALHSKKANSHVRLAQNDTGEPIGIKWNGYFIPFRDELNDYERAAFLAEIKYIDIVFEQFTDGWHYYATIHLHAPLVNL